MSTTSILANVPQELKDLPNWVQWKLTRNESGELGKVPFVAGTNFTKNAASTRSATWKTFEEATKNITLSSDQGVGFVIHGPVVEAGLVGFDLDGCRNPQTGDVTDWAQKLIDCLESYTELTPSLTGVRIWVRGKVSGKECVFNLDTAAGYGDKVKIEVFSNARYFTVTGDRFDPFLSEIETRDLKEAYKLCQEFKAKYPAKPKTGVVPESSSPTTTVAEGAQIQTDGHSTVITSKYEILMHGEIQSTKPFVIQDGHGNKLEYPSHSEADLALCTQSALLHVDSLGNLADKVWSDYAQSSLARDKWLNREQYFREHTIATAIKTTERINGEAPNTAEGKVAVKSKVAEAANQVTGGLETLVASNGDGLMKEIVAPRRVLLQTISNKEPVFFEQSINQIFAWRGTGKTNLGLGLTKAFATAGSFLNWEVPQRSRVLYVEGEMPLAQLQERWKQIVGHTDGYAHIVAVDKQPDHIIPSLSTKIGMDKVEATLAKLESEGNKIDILMLDSISTLFNIKANDEETWIAIQAWLIKLRSQGLAIFFFHHSGKGGMSRSHSKSEDILDVSIKLEDPEQKEEGILHAAMSYDKSRSGLSEPKAEIKMRRMHSNNCPCMKTPGCLIGCRGDSVQWEYKVLTDSKMEKAFKMFDEGSTLGEVAKEFRVARSTVQYWKTKWDSNRAARPEEAEITI